MATSISINTLNDSSGVNDFFTAAAASNYSTIQNFLIRASTMRRILASTSIGNTFTDNSIPFPKLNGTIASLQIAAGSIYGDTIPSGVASNTPKHIANNTIGPGNLTTDVIYWNSNSVGINVAANNANATLNVNGTFRSQNATFVGTSTTGGGQISLLDPVATGGTFGGWEIDNNAQTFRIFRDRLNPSPEPTVQALSISKAGETTVNDINVNAVRLRQTGSVTDTAYGFFGTSSLSNAGFYYDTTNSAISIASNGTVVARFSHSRTDTEPPIRFFQETVTVKQRGNRLVNENKGVYGENDGTKYTLRATDHRLGYGTTGAGATNQSFYVGQISTGRIGFGGDYGTDVRVKVHGDLEVTSQIRLGDGIISGSNGTVSPNIGFTKPISVTGGATFSGNVSVNGTITATTPGASSTDNTVATKGYVDNKVPVIPDLSTTYLKLDGSNSMTGDLVVQNSGPRLSLHDSNNTYSGVLHNTGNSFYLSRKIRSGTIYSEEPTTSAILTIDMSGATAVGTMLLRGAFRATGNITAFFTSDEKLKENILTIINPLEKIEQIKGVNFDWKQEEIDRSGGEDGYFVRKHDVGVIAQDIQKVLPEAVAKRTDGVLGVNYDKIIPLLIEAIKELNGKVKYLESKINN